MVKYAIDKLKNLFPRQRLYQIAHQSKLIQRTSSKLDPTSFLTTMIIESNISGLYSLSRLCDFMVANGGVLMTPQALSERLDSLKTVRFLKEIYSSLIASKFTSDDFGVKEKGVLGRFQNVYIEDSSSCKINEKVAGSFKASGGSGSKAGFKIHTIFNAKSNNISNLKITASNVPDASEAKNILKYIKKGDLILRDLGYFKKECFNEIEKKGAYYLSRLKSGVNIYSLEGGLIEDLGRYVEECIGNSNLLEVEVLLGKKEPLKVRLVAARITQSVYDKRVRKAKRKSEKNSRTLSKKHKAFQRFTFFITNIPSELLNKEEVPIMYKFRWQIELLFKSFKSQIHLDMIKGKSKNRVECYILAKLIVLMSTTTLFMHLSADLKYTHNRELSFFKFTGWIISHKYLRLLFCAEKLSYEVMQMQTINALSLCKQKRSKKTSRELLEEEFTYDDIYSEDLKIDPLEALA